MSSAYEQGSVCDVRCGMNVSESGEADVYYVSSLSTSLCEVGFDSFADDSREASGHASSYEWASAVNGAVEFSAYGV